jgi:hypothetical protein
MSRYASVSSIEVLKSFRASLGTFAEVASGALDETSGEIRRTSTWLRTEQYGYWKKQLQLRNGQFVQAKLALNRKEVFDRAISGSASSCLDEKKALQKAEKRLREAEHKFGQVKAWSQKIEKEVSDYRATVQGLVRAIEVDIPNSRAKLDKMIDSLEAYIALAPPETLTAGSLETTGDMNFVWSDMTRPTIDNEQSSKIRSLRQKGEALRKMTPSSRVRNRLAIDSGLVDRIAIDSGLADWIAEVKFSDALRSYVLALPSERAKTRPSDRVVLTLTASRPDTIYLERMPAPKGDSGWYIGSDNKTESDNCVVACVVDLVKLCPSLAEILSLPIGYVVVTSVSDGAEVVLDSNGDVKWCTSDSENSASEG